MSDDTRFDVAYDAILNVGPVSDTQVAALLAQEVIDALRAFDSTHSSDRSLGVRRWDVMTHESRLRQQFEREIRALPADASGVFVRRDEVLKIMKGPIGG